MDLIAIFRINKASLAGPSICLYRSICFETEVLDIADYQGNAVVNYTDCETLYTRIIEHIQCPAPCLRSNREAFGE